MDKNGTIKVVMPARSGVGTHGEWKSQGIVVECDGGGHVVGDISGVDRIARLNPQEGQKVTVYFDVDGHEWNGRWFPDVRIFDLRPWDGCAKDGANVQGAVAPGAAQ